MDFQNQLEAIISSETTRILAYNKAISFCQARLVHLKKDFLSDAKRSPEVDIHFFKTTKQLPQTQLFYYWALREYQASYPVSGKDIQKKYIKAKRKEAIAFSEKHLIFQKYLRLGESHFDHLYFTRNNSPNANKAQSIGSILESDFYTSHDILLSQILANNQLLHFYSSELKNLKNIKSNEVESLKWNGSKVAFTELVYGLYHTGVFGQKKVPVKVIAKVLANCFQLPSFDIYDSYGDIKRRKKEPSAFLNQMLLSFNQALENANNQV